jgi:hypothetical protein
MRELVDNDSSRYKGTRFNVDMSGESSVTGDDDAIAKLTVMSDVSIGHEKTVSTHPCHTAIVGTPMNGCELPNDTLIADLSKALSAFELQVLRLSAQNRSLTHRDLTSQQQSPFENSVGTDTATVPNDDAWLNHDVGTDRYLRPDLALGAHRGFGINRHRFQRKT